MAQRVLAEGWIRRGQAQLIPHEPVGGTSIPRSWPEKDCIRVSKFLKTYQAISVWKSMHTITIHYTESLKLLSASSKVLPSGNSATNSHGC